MHRRRFLQSVVTTVGLAGIAGCAGAPTDDEPTETASPTAEQASPTSPPESPGGPTVDMVTDGDEFYFDPIGLHVDMGTAVTWRIENGAHSSTAYAPGNDGSEVRRIPEEAEPWDSGTLSEAGATFSHTFDVVGTYDYFCLPHKSLGMVGRVVVDEPSGPAEGSMPPDGNVPDSDTIVEQGTVAYADFGG